MKFWKLFESPWARAVGVGLALGTFYVLWRRYQRKKIVNIDALPGGKELLKFTDSFEPSEKEIEKYFLQSTEVVRHLNDLTTDNMLLLYGLYKQGNFGPCTDPEPSSISFEKLAKWSAWMKFKHMPKLSAKHQYIEVVIHLMLHPEESDLNPDDQDQGQSLAPVGSKMKDEPIPDSIFTSAVENKIEEIRNALENSSQSVNELFDPDTELSLLHLAADRGHLELTSLLLSEFGADPNIIESSGFDDTPLHSVCAPPRKENHQDMIDLLVKAGGDMNKPNSENETPQQLLDEE